MPKTEIDYSNTLIYKITCKDLSIKEVYVGHTTNFVQRKYSHKQSCINTKSTNHKCKLYTIIRENGGWKNWIMEIVTFFNCKDHYEARTKEQEYFLLLNATLNSIEPMPKPKPGSKPKSGSKPKAAIEPLPTVIDPLNIVKGVSGFCCEICNYSTFIKCDFLKHLSTKTHTAKQTNITVAAEKLNMLQAKPFHCDNCGHNFTDRSNLHRHKIKCNEHINVDNVQSSQLDKDALIIGLLKQNTELQTQLIELMKTFAPPSIPIN